MGRKVPPLAVGDIARTRTKPPLYGRIESVEGKWAIVKVLNLPENPEEFRGSRIRGLCRLLVFLPTAAQIEAGCRRAQEEWDEETRYARSVQGEYWLPGTDRYFQQPGPVSGAMDDHGLYDDDLDEMDILPLDPPLE